MVVQQGVVVTIVVEKQVIKLIGRKKERQVSN